MKPTLTKETVILTYWKCAVEKHRHQTEEVAARCMAKRAKVSKIHLWTDAERVQLLESVLEGKSVKASAEALGRSPLTARHQIGKAMHRLQWQNEESWPWKSYFVEISEIRANPGVVSRAIAKWKETHADL